jgi:hypothetical protein
LRIANRDGVAKPAICPQSVLLIYNSPSGSERGPVALPVFKIGRSPLTRGGWVRLPGASANLRSRMKAKVARRSGVPTRHALQLSAFSNQRPHNSVGVTEVLQHRVGSRGAQILDGVAAGRNRHRSRAGECRARHVQWRIADHHRVSG